MNNNIYYRFGEIPKDEKSCIWKGDKCIGYENGVSVYEAFKNIQGVYVPIFPMPKTETTWDSYCYYMNYFRGHHYLVEGEYIGLGSDGEPIIKNIKVVKTLK